MESALWDFLRNMKWDIKYLFSDIRRGNFLFQGRKIRYFTHRYNCANLNERTIEVPIIHQIIKKYRGKHILEIGNVLAHYFHTTWDICDISEKGKGVINKDIVGFKPLKKYDLVVSISTFEHIGYDRAKMNADNQFLDAINNVYTNIMHPDGSFIITVPLGYNIGMDRKLFAGESNFTKIYWFRRISADNRWQESSKDEVMSAKYNAPFQWANAIAICANRDLTA